jgi:hypothetical protein
MKHPPERELALYAAGDLPLMWRIRSGLHLSRCPDCKRRVEAYKADRERRLMAADRMPEGVDWEALSVEMAANIRVGLAAGECVAEGTARSRAQRGSRLHRSRNWLKSGWLHTWITEFDWRPAAVIAGVMVLLAGAWWLNMPAADNGSLSRAMRAIARGGPERGPQLIRGARGVDDRTPVVEVNASGIRVRENGSALGVSQGGLRPVAVSVSVQGSASAHYVDNDTGQVTITSVYAE